MKNADVLKALKGMSTKVRLHVLYDAGKAGAAAPRSIPNVPPRRQAINDAGLKAFAQAVTEEGGHLMHDKFIVRDGASVWSGSAISRAADYCCRTNNFFTMDSPPIAAAYSKTFGDLGSPGHSASHTPPVTTSPTASSPTKVKIGSIPFTIFFSTQVGATEGIETVVQNRLKGAKKIPRDRDAGQRPGYLASCLRSSRRTSRACSTHTK